MLSVGGTMVDVVENTVDVLVEAMVVNQGTLRIKY